MKEIQLSKGHVAIVDDEDYEYLNQWRWYATTTKSGLTYAATSINSKSTLMHRLIMGVTDRHMLVDHVFGETLNNQRQFLRVVTHSQNQHNRRRAYGSSIYKGVYYASDRGKWRASIECFGKRYLLGTHATEEMAAIAYNKAAKIYHGEFAYLNELPI